LPPTGKGVERPASSEGIDKPAVAIELPESTTSPSELKTKNSVEERRLFENTLAEKVHLKKVIDNKRDHLFY